jgi:ribonuclease P protein component
MAGERLPAGERLKGRNTFQELMREGLCVEDHYMVIRFLPRTEDSTHRRSGVAVSRNCRNAVKRNKLRRWLREIYRRERDLLPTRGEFLFIAKSDAKDASYVDLKRSFKNLCRDLAEKNR